MDTVIDWDRIDTVWLDLDGTVLDLHFDVRFWHEHLPARYAQTHGIERALAEQRLAPLFADTAGRLPFYCLDYWSQATGLDMLALSRELQHLIRPLDGALDALARMAGRGFKLALATNAHPDIVALKFALTGIGERFAPAVSAHSTGYAKESPGFWQALVRDYGLVPERALFVDDSPAVVAAAEVFGIGQVVGLTRPDSRGPERAQQCARRMPDLAALAATLPTTA
ncbi:MAG TPA: HAD-IA family hydrolase [Salinisphaeraceae bacterium]|nr:HAD-IA family hydrolase [Salinisphaeraceae bacterium]